MPNWCSTTITINSSSEQKAKELYELLDEWTTTPCIENGFGNSWLGNIVQRSGLDTYDMENHTFHKGYYPRGSVTWLNLSDCQISMDTETAWTPKLRVFVDLLDKYDPDAELIYTAEECGCELFYTNDPTIEGDYCVDCFELIDGFEEGMTMMTEDELKAALNGRTLEDVEDYVSIHKYEYAEISEWWE